jgi:hypothetical protein
MDFYTEARKLAKELQGLDIKEGDDMVEELETGSTGTEILMGLRWHVNRVLGISELPPEIRHKCKELLTKIEPFLK